MMPEQGAWLSKNGFLGLKTGYLFDDTYDRKLRLVGQGTPSFHHHVGEGNWLSHLGVFTVNFADRVELFTTLGTLSAHWDHHPIEGIKISYHMPTHFCWGIGGRAILAYWKDLQFGVNASYLSYHSSLSSLKINHATHQEGEVALREWQVGIGISYRFKWFIPYMAMDYSDFRARIGQLKSIRSLVGTTHLTFKDVYPLGPIFGIGISPEKAFNINIECRFINENALSASCDFRF